MRLTQSASGARARPAADATADPTAHAGATGDLPRAGETRGLAGGGAAGTAPGGAGGQPRAGRQPGAEAAHVEEEQVAAAVAVVAVVVVDDLAVLVGAVRDLLVLLAVGTAAGHEAGRGGGEHRRGECGADAV